MTYEEAEEYADRCNRIYPDLLAVPVPSNLIEGDWDVEFRDLPED